MAQMDPQVPIDVTDDDKLWALLSWILAPIVPIIVLLLEDKKVRPFIKYHAFQALVVGIVTAISAALMSVIIGCVTTPLLVIYEIYLAIQSYQGKWVTIPVVTDFCKGQGWIS
jgi:uncharacterized membrane protein